MDEITMINLLNEICSKNPPLFWKINCKYHDGLDKSIMEIALFDPGRKVRSGYILFEMDESKILQGRYRSMVPFQPNTNLIDALLEILQFESARPEYHLN
ncbi:MAG: hypothetical protein OEY56_13825 [Cyclobacteriaceae bacterium]|nr:hypothetical protein [Cyclobacteriaceae bacterium]